MKGAQLSKVKSEGSNAWMCRCVGEVEHVFPVNAKVGSRCWCGESEWRWQKLSPNLFVDNRWMQAMWWRDDWWEPEPEEGTVEEAVWFLTANKRKF